jgi:glutamate transport system permease protein
MAMTPTEAALFEAAGPHARRRILVGTVVTSLLFVALVVWLIMRLDANGQFDPMYWDLFANINIWKFLGAGFIGTARAALSSGVIALVGGLVLMFGRISGIAPVRWLATAVIEFVRGTPTLLFIYFFFLVPSQFGIHISTYWMVVIPVSFYASAVLAEVYRAGVQAVPAGQKEAAISVGMSRWQSYRLIILPQMFRIIVPTMVTQLVVVGQGHHFRLRRHLPRDDAERESHRRQLHEHAAGLPRRRRHLHPRQLRHLPLCPLALKPLRRQDPRDMRGWGCRLRAGRGGRRHRLVLVAASRKQVVLRDAATGNADW